MNLLEKAIEIAVQAHDGQTDRYGQPYIRHPERVMKMGKGKSEKIVGILHDVVEDTDITFADLHCAGIPPQMIMALVCLTRNKGKESYDDYITRVSSNPLAVAVKLNDLTDNMDLRRYTELGEGDIERLKKYHAAYMRLKSISKPKKDRFEEARKKNPNAYKPWNTDQDDTLERLFCEGHTVEQLAGQMHRSTISIECRILLLELPDKYGIDFIPSQTALKYHQEQMDKKKR